MSFCLCTVALGKEYRECAKNLIDDAANFAPDVPFLLFTDKPCDFIPRSGLTVTQYTKRSVSGVYDKTYVIRKAIELYETVLFMDADSRITGKLPAKINFDPGISTLSSCGYAKHFGDRLRQRRSIKVPAAIKEMADYNPIKIIRFLKFSVIKYRRILKLSSKIRTFKKFCGEFGVDFEKVVFVHEIIFSVTRQKGREKEFFKYYDKMVQWLESHGVFKPVAWPIGAAAEKAGLHIRWEGGGIFKDFPYFKDRIVFARTKKGQKVTDQERTMLRIRDDISRQFKEKPIDK